MRRRFRHGNGKNIGLYALYYSKTSGFSICNSFAAAAKSLRSCATLCDPIDGSPPGSSVLGILQARTLEWVAISFSPFLGKLPEIPRHFGIFFSDFIFS